MRRCFVHREQEKTFSKIDAWEVEQVSSAHSSKLMQCFFLLLSLSVLFIRRTSLSVLFAPALTNLLNLPNHMENGFFICDRMKPGYWPNLFLVLSCSLKMYFFLSALRPSGFAITTRLEPYSHMQTMGSGPLSNPLDILTQTKLHYDV